jgi:hypothetical protein
MCTARSRLAPTCMIMDAAAVRVQSGGELNKTIGGQYGGHPQRKVLITELRSRHNRWNCPISERCYQSGCRLPISRVMDILQTTT